MDLAGEYTFEAPREVVWDAIMNPDVLRNILPGCESLERVSDNEYNGTLNVRVGPVQGKFTGKVVLSDLQKPERFHLEIDGQGAAGFVRGGGDARLELRDGKTVLLYEGKADVGGRIASVGQRLLDTSARSLTRQSLESLDRLIQAQLQPPPPAEEGVAPPPPPEMAPPSEVQVALGVAKDIFEEYVPARYRPVVLGAAAGVALILLVWLLRKLFGR
ncbi:MAG: carbon monoxide dehydrogenase subunit G [Caldilineales bacterium]|nr:carbon monoxide dehydrogenase subunit G [Caldilineales bacterium]